MDAIWSFLSSQAGISLVILVANTIIGWFVKDQAVRDRLAAIMSEARHIVEQLVNGAAGKMAPDQLAVAAMRILANSVDLSPAIKGKLTEREVELVKPVVLELVKRGQMMLNGKAVPFVQNVAAEEGTGRPTAP